MININKNSVVNLQEDVVERNVMIITQNANGLVKLLQQNITGNVQWLKLEKVLKKKKCCKQVKVCFGKKCKIEQGKCYWRGCLKSEKKISKCIRKKINFKCIMQILL